MFKKFKQKRQLLLASTIALISINLLGFLPIFVNAQTITPQGPAAGCDLTTSDFSNSKLELSKSAVASSTEQFAVYFEADIPGTIASQCSDTDKANYAVSVYAYNDDWGTTVSSIFSAYNYEVAYPVSFFDENGKTGFRQKVNGLSLAFLYSGSKLGGPGSSVRFYAYWHKLHDDPSMTQYIPSGGVPMTNSGTSSANDTSSWPSITGVTADQTSVNRNESVDYTKIGITITANSSAQGLRTKYRVLASDTEIKFGQTAGLDPVYMKWRDDSPGLQLRSGDTFLLPKKDDSWLNVDLDPAYKGSTVGFNYADAKIPDYQACRADYFSTDCSAAYFDNEKGKPADPYKPIPDQYNPTLTSAAWLRNRTSSAGAGKPIATNDFIAVPSIYGFSSKLGTGQNGNVYVVYGQNTPKFTVEVYATEADLIAACKADNTVTDKTKCDDLNYAKFGFASTISQSTTSTDPKDNSPKTLFGFILEVIVYIVVAITSVIYWIFSYILVPIINVLLRVRPFQDQFVNVIYPGWLIVRNLANIFFIIALLVMGLRVLFQIDDAGKTRSFIVKLILMALLVNFSLVIAQGIVAIADTVQSQFLPANTKVVEALGKSLMADPAIAFQTKVTNGGLDSSATSDLFTPIMLLVTSVAGFFSFIAIAAFIAIRMVALWIFYLTSPFAYFGRVLSFTKSYADRWWTEFIKYVFMVPVLVFFLNIAALMAGTLAKQNPINIQANQYLSDKVLTGFEGAALTVISQAIVLIFLFAGMRIALASGTIGSKAVVDFAKKGFKNSLTKWPGTAKDIAADWAARGAKKAGAPSLSKAITAVAKPMDVAKAARKKWMDDPAEARRKRQAEAVADIPGLTRSASAGKFGGSLKDARTKMKDFESDDVNYLSSKMADGFRKSDKDTLNAAMLKLGQEGKFKDILEQAEKLSPGKTYSKDAAGLNAMTEDMVKSGKITEDNRRDLLNEFDQAAKKKKGNTHYGGNVTYDPVTKKFEVRKRDPKNEVEYQNNTYENDKSWVRAQIKARTGDDPKGSLKADLTQVHESAAVKANGELTDAQVGVFAEQTPNNLGKQAIWKAAEEANPNKFIKMREALNNDDKRAEVRTRMIRYYNAVAGEDGDPRAAAKADERITALRNVLFNQNNQPTGSGNGGRRQVGFIRQNDNQPNQGGNEEDEEEEDEDEEPQARTNNQTRGSAQAPRTVNINPISSSQSMPTTSSTSTQHEPPSMPIGDQVVGSKQINLSRGSTYPVNEQTKDDQQNITPAKPKNQIGFTKSGQTAKPSDPELDTPEKPRLFGERTNFDDEANQQGSNPKPNPDETKPE